VRVGCSVESATLTAGDSCLTHRSSRSQFLGFESGPVLESRFASGVIAAARDIGDSVRRRI
jgi:hypothetical protein